MKNGIEKENFILGLIDTHMHAMNDLTITELYEFLKPYFIEKELVQIPSKGKNKIFEEIEVPFEIKFSTFKKRIESLIQQKKIFSELQFVKRSGSKRKIYLVNSKKQ